ncbi:MAG: gamma-glutamylcyclotransferase, partial [Planktomarina sp.]
ALRVDETAAEHVLQELRARELISSAYVEKWVDLPLADGRIVRAVTYVVDRDHAQYCRYGLDQQAQIIAGAVGGRGPNPEYLFKTAEMLHDLGIPDPQLDYLAEKVANLTNCA